MVVFQAKERIFLEFLMKNSADITGNFRSAMTIEHAGEDHVLELMYE